VDFEQVYNISQGTFLQVQTNFKVADIFNQIKTVTQQDFSKRNNQVIFEVEPTVPTFIRAPMVIFRQLLLNIIATIVAGSFRSVITISARSETHDQGEKTLVITIANKKNSFNKDQMEQIEDLCEEDDLVRILESLEAVDVNFVIALIMARQNGWPLDF
jgi:signal transduction histidine kinase